MDTIDRLLGITVDQLAWWQAGLRALLAIVVLVVMVRLGNKRLFAKSSALDMVVSIMVGSTMASSITSPGPILPVYTAAAVLVGVHSLLTTLAARYDVLGPILKGRRVRLVRDGRLLRENMTSSAITERELEEALRSEGEEPELDRIQHAWLERDGGISLDLVDQSPRVVDIEVRDGVQRVRVELG